MAIPITQVFSCYSRCLAELDSGAHVARTLRIFELHLLHALGYGLELDADAATGEPLRADLRYVFELEQGLAPPSSMIRTPTCTPEAI